MASYIRCVICDSINRPTKLDAIVNGYTCAQCRTSTFEPWGAFADANIFVLIAELEERIPALFDPTKPSCPGDGSCDCTYQEGCRELNQARHPRTTTDPRELLGMQAVLDLPRRSRKGTV
jgi:hypothetical protein